MRRRLLVVQSANGSADSFDPALGQRLEQAGYEVKILFNHTQPMKAVLEFRPALVLLVTHCWKNETQDLLWEMGDLNRTRAIRKIVFALSATMEDRVAALDLGADDFLLHPISARELLARIQAVLRSHEPICMEEDIQTLGSLCLYRDGMEVSIGAERVKLSRREYGLLAYLMDRPGRVLSREELLENLWYPSGEIEDPRVVDVYVWRLREKIENDPSQPRRLITRRREGYSLVDPQQGNSNLP